MFKAEIYKQRRNILKKRMKSGRMYFPGNAESPMNYPANPYPFRQDSTFLYYWGLDLPGLTAVLDVDRDEAILFGDDFTVDDIVWMGPQPTLAENAARVGVGTVRPMADLEKWIQPESRESLHFLPPYRAENRIALQRLTGIPADEIGKHVSVDFIRAVAAQRSVKSAGEVEEIEKALKISYDMVRLAMSMVRPGMIEQEVYGAVEGLVLSRGSRVSFPVICSVHGETLHNHHHHHIMEEGQLLVLDSGAESPGHYASDITRTIPVSGSFSPEQRAIYEICLKANEKAIDMMKPGVPFREVHLRAATIIAGGMKDLGFMKGDTDEAVAAGAHALFFPHGLGHMMGLDVHDMENLGEDYVGYSDQVKRSDQFGLAYLRMGKPLEEGHVITVEPGIYFIPELADQWKTQKKFTEFIDYNQVSSYIGFGGVRIEDDVLITPDGHRVLGKPIARSPGDVEAWCAGA
ncbi:MAG TPA: aminopeptidase P family protein [bacterium]|nr:aminopeptidase P family protein [bacterium]